MTSAEALATQPLQLIVGSAELRLVILSKKAILVLIVHFAKLIFKYYYISNPILLYIPPPRSDQ
jgi:hypothetical protein